jgi:hypothetical protein
MSEFKFSCPVCGQNVLCDTALAGTQLACPHCDNTIGVPTGFAKPTDVSSGTVIPSPLSDDVVATAQKTSGLAIASLVCSLSSFITCIGWLPGIICGHLAKSRIRRNSSLKGNGLATAGLIIGYLIVMLEAGTAAVKIWRFSTAMKQGYENVRLDMETNNFIVQSTNVSNDNQMEPANSGPVATNDQPIESAESGWVADIGNVSFPDHPASGKIHGLDFTVKSALFRGGDLKLSSANGMSLEIIHGLGSSIAGQSYEIQSTDDNSGNPRVKLTWHEGDEVQSTTFNKGFGIKLKFAQVISRKIAAKIYVCLPDDSKSYVAGTFEVRVPKPQ